jgi:SpoVK/Ycf46/Vps4 family AAA+-type ATPase
VILEYKKKNELLKYGYLPKSKLLFWGPPGCGKSLTAKYLGQELGIPVGHLNLSSIVSSLLGETSTNLQKVFEVAKEKPCVLLIDEFDSLGKFRDDPNDVGELKRIVNSLLFIIDGWFSSNSILIAATNHSYLLDPALWRRFDDIVYFPLPEISDRNKYLKRILSGVKFGGSIESISEKLEGLSFADIEKILRESVKTMILEGKKSISSKDVLLIIRQFKKDLLMASSKIKG